MMFGNSVSQALNSNQAQVLAQSYLDQARLQKTAQHLDVALVLYNQAKVAFKNIVDTCQVTPLPLSQLKSAFSKAKTSQEDVLRQRIAEVYFERAELLKGLGNLDKAKASYKKAQAWGYEEIKLSRIARTMSLPVPSVLTVVQTATPTTMPINQKSALVEYLFEKALSTLGSLELSHKPSLFLVYAHDNPKKGQAEASTSKYLIEKLSQLRVKLHSDQAPMAQPYSSPQGHIKEDGKLEDILISQLCLLPTPLRRDVGPVDKVVVCCSEVLGSYLKWPDYNQFYQELRDAYHADEKTYLQDDTQSGTLEIRRVIRQFIDKEDFHHVLTEIAFLQIRAEKLLDKHGIVLVSLTKNSGKNYLKNCIEPTSVRIDDIPRFQEQARAGKALYRNQSRHWVLFKLIERLLVSSPNAKIFLDKFWHGYSDLISRLENESSTPGHLEFIKLLDRIFDDIRTALQSQLAFTVQQQYQLQQMLNADPRVALKEQYDAAFKQNKAFEEALQLYVEPRGIAGFQSTKTSELLPLVQSYLKNKDVILLAGDSGAGKTTFSRILEKRLWEQNEDANVIPLFISLPRIDKPEDDLIAKALRKRGLSEFQILTLKEEKQQFVFILDGYDEIRQTQNLYLSNFINQDDGWQGRMVISCRSEYLGQDYRSRFQAKLNLKDQDQSFQEIMIAPFSEEERNQYLKKYVQRKPTGWAVQRYQEAFEQPHLKDFGSNPFLLQVVLEALPYLDNEGKDQTAVKLRMDLYDQFVKRWFEHNEQRLSTQDLTRTKREIFIALSDDGFAKYGTRFVKDLAVHLYTENAGNPVVDYSLLKDEGNWKDAFFGREEEKQLLREAWPLLRIGNQYRFIHKTLLEYFVARSLFESFDACMVPNIRPRRSSDVSIYSFENKPVLPSKILRDVSLAPKDWVRDLGVVQLLTERVKQEPTFKKQLLAIIECSKIDASVRQAAANAITILVMAGVPFLEADLSGIQIPGANLSYGVFDLVQLQGADLRKVNLIGAWLRNTDLSCARMEGAQFGELPGLELKETVHACSYSSDGQLFIVSYGKTVALYDTHTLEEKIRLIGNEDQVESLVMSADCRYVVSWNKDKMLQVWDCQTPGATPHFLGWHESEVTSVVISADSRYVVSGSNDKKARVWDLQTPDAGPRVFNGHESGVTSVVVSPDGQYAVSGSDDGAVRVWDLQTPVAAPRILSGHKDVVASVVMSTDCRYIVSGSWDNTVQVWDWRTPEAAPRVFKGHADLVSSVVISADSDSQYVVFGSDDKIVRVWDWKTPEATPYVLGEHKGVVTSVVISADGKYVVSGSKDNTVQVWDWKTPEASPLVLSKHKSEVTSVAISADSRYVVFGSNDNTVRVWDLHKPDAAPRILGWHKEVVTSVVISADDRYVVSGSKDNTAQVWDLQTPEAEPSVLRGHESWVTSVVISADGKYVVSGGYDDTMRVWDIASSQCLLTVHGFNGSVNSVAWKHIDDIDYLITGSDDKMVRCWQLIAADNQWQVRLRWTSGQDALTLVGANIEGVEGLSPINSHLLTQRGTTGVPRETGVNPFHRQIMFSQQ